MCGVALIGAALGFLASSQFNGWQSVVAAIAPVGLLVGLADKLLPAPKSAKIHFAVTVIDMQTKDTERFNYDHGDWAMVLRFNLKNLGDPVSDLNTISTGRFILRNEGKADLMTNESTTFTIGPYPKSPFRVKVDLPFQTYAGRSSVAVVFSHGHRLPLITVS